MGGVARGATVREWGLLGIDQQRTSGVTRDLGVPLFDDLFGVPFFDDCVSLFAHRLHKDWVLLLARTTSKLRGLAVSLRPSRTCWCVCVKESECACVCMRARVLGWCRV
jgi:hypothetical protein